MSNFFFLKECTKLVHFPIAGGVQYRDVHRVYGNGVEGNWAGLKR